MRLNFKLIIFKFTFRFLHLEFLHLEKIIFFDNIVFSGNKIVIKIICKWIFTLEKILISDNKNSGISGR